MIETAGHTTKAPDPSLGPPESRRILYALTIAITLTIVGTIVAAYAVIFFMLPLYHFVKEGDEHRKKLRGSIYRVDPELGYATVPGAQVIQLLPPGPDVPLRFDENGFRIPASSPQASIVGNRRPLILTLGCSFTMGAATLAEETFPYLVGEFLGGSTKNAGLSGGGLSQILLLARKLIPAIKPNYVIVQYSPWLAERSQSPFAPSLFGRVPQPYFSGDDGILRAPEFRAKVYDLPWSRYQTTPKSATDFVSFLWEAAVPLSAHTAWNMSVFYGKRASGAIPPPTRDASAIERIVYREIEELSRANGARAVLVVIGVGATPVPIHPGVGQGYTVVDANRMLNNQLSPQNREQWIREYAHWRGDPPKPVDFHPNAKAHRLIAEQVRDAIRAGRADR